MRPFLAPGGRLVPLPCSLVGRKARAPRVIYVRAPGVVHVLSRSPSQAGTTRSTILADPWGRMWLLHFGGQGAGVHVCAMPKLRRGDVVLGCVR
jgi:hypothetical protein